MTIQLEYINHLLQFFNISYYAGIMLNAFIVILCSKLCWHNRLVPSVCVCVRACARVYYIRTYVHMCML